MAERTGADTQAGGNRAAAALPNGSAPVRGAASVPLALFERMHRFVELSRAVRRAGTAAELGFLLCNRTRDLVPYRQAVLWTRDAPGGVRIVNASGVAEVDRGSAYVQLLEALVVRRFPALAGRGPATASSAPALPSAAAQAVHTPLLQEVDTRPAVAPGHADAGAGEPLVTAAARAQWDEDGAPLLVFVLLRSDASRGLLLLRDAPMSEAEGGVLTELQELYAHADAAIAGPGRLARLQGRWQRWRQLDRRLRIGAAFALLAVLLFPVRLSVVASGQLVAQDPAIVTAPLNGVVAAVLVDPSAPVRAGQPLYRIDDRDLAHQFEVAEEELAVAEERVQQSAQRSFDDGDASNFAGAGNAAAAQGVGVGVLEHDMQRARAQRDYYRELLARVEVRAPADGVALFSSPQDWIGRPVKIGEKVMEVARPASVAVEAWLPAENAIPLEPGDTVLFYPEAFPLSAVKAQVMTIAYLAEPQGDTQQLAYRVRARVEAADDVARVGQLGTARLYGDRTVLAYLLLRRPLNALRQWAGW